MMTLRKKSIDDIYRQAQSIKVELAGGCHSNWVSLIDKILYRYIDNIKKSAAYLHCKIANHSRELNFSAADFIRIRNIANSLQVYSPVYMSLI